MLRRGVPFEQLRMRQADGTLIAEVPTPRTGGERLPATLGALRSDLQAVLCEHVYAAGVTVRLGLSVRAIAQDSRRAYVEFTDGSTGGYDLVVGADGIRSAVRGMLGIATVPQPTGMSIWRVVADRPAELDCAELYYGGPRYEAGYSPISAGQCYAYLLDTDGAEGGFGPGPAWELMYRGSAGYGGTWGKIRATIGPGSNVSHTRIEWLLVDDPWYRGRAIVIGDAAHACPPLIAQGAAMCAEDAVVLAELVAGDIPVERAPPAFMARRRPRVELVVRNSLRLVRWEMGLEPHTDADVAAVIRRVRPQLTSVERRLADLDAIGVDVQVVGPMPMHRYWAGPGLAGKLTTVINEAVDAHCAAAAGRLYGLGTLPLHPALAVRELERAVTGLGLAGVSVSTSVDGRELADRPTPSVSRPRPRSPCRT